MAVYYEDEEFFLLYFVFNFLHSFSINTYLLHTHTLFSINMDILMKNPVARNVFNNVTKIIFLFRQIHLTKVPWLGNSK